MGATIGATRARLKILGEDLPRDISGDAPMLTDTKIRNTKPSSKIQRIYDTGGLYVEVAPSGGKWWRLKYRFGGKEKRLSLGTYPATSLGQAREKRDEARKLLAQGFDPSVARREAQAKVEEASLTFAIVAHQWYEKKRPSWTPGTAERILRRLEKDLLPPLGSTPIKQVAPRDILTALKAIESRGCLETARRASQDCKAIFSYAFSNMLIEMDPMPATRGVLMSAPVIHHPSITDPRAVGELMRALWGYQGSPVTLFALKLAAFTFVRPGELRHAEWAEFDVEKAEWRIPIAKMKMREKHIVPLSKQVLEVLGQLRPLTGATAYLFPSERSAARPMSENTINAALRRLGYSQNEMTGHGFRSMASTLLNELGLNRDWIERQLAHAERNGVRAAYCFADYLDDRRKMMQRWADYLDGLREGGKVVPLFKATAGE